MEELRLRFLGGTSIRLGKEERLEGLPGKALALLCYLAVTDEAQSRGTLASLLWSDFPEHRARGNLRDMLTILRRTPLAPYLDICRRTVAFNKNLPHWLDTAEFQKGIAQYTADHCPDQCTLEAAVDLYQGEFLAGFNVPKAALFEEWQTVRRRQFHLQAVDALQWLVNHYLDAGAHVAALPHARHLLALDPWREEAHRSLMLLLMLSGELNAAVQQYEQCRQILAEELGIDPAPETRTLYENICERVDGRQATGAAPQTQSAPPLPGQITPFFGREREQRAIDIVLRDHTGRLITVFGVGGSGKTRLALAVAEKQMGEITRDGRYRFPDGVFFVPLQTTESPDEIVPALCQAIGFQPADESQIGQSAERQLLDHLRNKQLLLVIDNFEQLMDGVGLLGSIHRAAPGVHLLVTSRQKLGLQGERLYALEGLAYPGRGEEILDAGQLLGHYAAAALFVAGAQRAMSDFQLQDEEVPALIRLCRLVDGLPLALELAAGWSNVLSITDIAAEMEQGLTFLESDLHDLPNRHRNMEAVFDVTWRRLSAAEQALFARLCVFRGGFTRQAALEVVGASLRQLATLANKALIEFDKKQCRYQIHRLLHQFGSGKLARWPEGEKQTRDRHCAFFCAALQQWDNQLMGIGQLEALSELDQESANAFAAWQYAAAGAKFGELDRAAGGLFRYCLWRRRFRTGRSAARLVEEALREQLGSKTTAAGNAETKRFLARVLTWRSLFEDQDMAAEHIAEARLFLDDPELGASDTRRERAFALRRAGDLVFEQDNQEARQLYEDSLAFYRELHNSWGTAKVLTTLGWLAAHSGETEEARQLVKEALAIVQNSGDRKQTADILWLLATLAIGEGQLEESGHLFAECLDLRKALGDRLTDIVAGPIDLGMSLTWIGRFAEADAIREEALALYQAQELPERIAQAHVFLANSKMHIGQFELSKHHALTGLRLCREVGNQRGAGMALWTLAMLSLSTQAIDQANSYIQESEDIFRRLEGADELLGWIFGLRAEIARRQGQPGLAKAYICRALRLASGILGLITIQLSLWGFLLILADEGQEEMAVEINALLEKYPLMVKSVMSQALFAGRPAEIKAGLPPAVVEEAQARGRARDLQQTGAEILAELEETVWA